MPTQSHQLDRLDQALDALDQAVAAWDPDQGPAVDPMLSAVREVLVCFDPRKERVAASFAVVAMKLLEEISCSGSVGSSAAIGAVSELSSGLRESFRGAARNEPVRSGANGNEVMLSAPKESGGLSLSIGVAKAQRLGEVLIQMRVMTQEQIQAVLTKQAEQGSERQRFGEIAIELGFASQAQIENALRMQARSRGQSLGAGPKDPWGDRPV